MMDLVDLGVESSIEGPYPEETPYCCLYLDDATLKKLGLSFTDFEPGKDVVIGAVACVRSIQANNYGGETRQSVDLRIESLGILNDDSKAEVEEETAKPPKSVGDRLYGSD